MKKDPLDLLAKQYGIAGSYRDFRDEPHEVSRASRIAILAGLGIEAGDEQAIDTASHVFETTRWMRALPPVIVGTIGEAVQVPISVPLELRATRVSWVASLEDGTRRDGNAPLPQLKALEQGDVDGRRFSRVALVLPKDLPLGYHRIAIELDTGLAAEARLIVAPTHCHRAAGIESGTRAWGIAVQLYSLRSGRNWGMGDFRDLQELITHAAPLGCSLIGLNPLHALMPADPAHISPYSPSSRQFLNVLYISVPDVPEFAECAEARARVDSREFQTQLEKLRQPANVDYPGVARAKFEILRQVYEHFRSQHLQTDSPRAAAFREYVAARGEPLQLHAIYDALDADFRRQGPQYWGWPSWPEEYRDPTSTAVNRFARDRAVEVEYFLWLQWLAEEQLAAAQKHALTSGMSIGLYGDVAVGANSGGSETWANRHLYLQGASVGAPPDALALKGQDWGIPPQNPFELANQEFQPFIVMIRNNMRAVGALRLDHVMTLFRLWWVPRGMISAHGTYVHYPLRELIAILALESVRHRCTVIGEDLGTVPEEVRLAMERYELNHYKVLLFEQDSAGFKSPDQYVRSALATVTTHDLPTLRSWWESHDIELRQQLNLYPSEAVHQLVQEARDRELPAMMAALVKAGLWHWQSHEPLPPYSPALSRAIHAFLGLTASSFAMIQIEDLIGMVPPVNVPGTDKEHANWQRKVEQNTSDIFARAEVRDLLEAVNRARRGENPNEA